MNDSESLRLLSLDDYSIIDTLGEPTFDRITRLVSTIFGFPAAGLGFDDGDRHWFKSRQGIEAQDLARCFWFGDHVAAGDRPLVVPDAQKDIRFAHSPYVTGEPYVRFYVGAPLTTANAGCIGSLCLFSNEPYEDFGETQCEILESLAYTAVELVEARARQTKLAIQAREIAYLAHQDPLTQIGNRRHLDRLLHDALKGIKQNEQVVLYYLDLDGFKHVNDSLGHPAGDQLLREVSMRLRGHVGNTKTIARIGGDEFAIIQWSSNAAETAPYFANSLIRAVARPYALEGRVVHIGTSIGASVARYPAPPPEQILKEADRALYQAKSSGRGRFVSFDRNIPNPLESKFAISRIGSGHQTERPSLYQAHDLKLVLQRRSGTEAGT